MRTVVLLLIVGLAGCLGPDPVLDDADALLGADLPLPPLLPPVVLTDGTRGGFEPSIVVGPEGTVYVTGATTTRPGEVGGSGGRLASWLWYSPDGETWNDLPSPAGVHAAMLGLEGDVAVDGEGRLYFVDTYAAENSLHRWSPPPALGDAPAWDRSLPVQGTGSVVDDRPWLTAHGDGVVYLMSNNGAALPSPERLDDGDATAGSKWLHRSEDGGLTWSPGHGFVGWCYPAADPSDDTDLVVTCVDAEAGLVQVHESRNRGDTWTTPFETELDLGAAVLVPGAAVDRDGTRHAAWIDDDSGFENVQDFVWHGDQTGRVLVADARDDGAWSEPQDVTPFPGRFGMLHSAAGSGGVHAVAFYATTDLVVDEETEWTPHLLLSTDADGDGPATYRHVPLLDAPAGVGTTPPRDFFQVAVGPDDRVHAILQRARTGDDHQPGDGIAADLLYVRQA